jgi:ubiquinone/menaquinone biosynthesis C-methylase UbiE
MEYVIGHLKAVGTHLFLFDLSPALLEMAHERVKKHGLEDQVTLVVGDVLKVYRKDGSVDESQVTYLNKNKDEGVKSFKPLPSLGQADLVTCSYCLTMIPPWKAALEVMVSMLKAGGSLSLIDFTKREDKPNHWTQRLNGWWFANDGVYFDERHTATLKQHPDLETVWYQEAEARVPYTPLMATHYCYTGVKK